MRQSETDSPHPHVNPAKLLWPGTEVYQHRFEKSGVALIAVKRALSAEADLVPEIKEFFSLYEWVSRVDAEVFTRVWSDPVAFFWVRRAVHFIAACRGEPMGTAEKAYCAQLGIANAKDALRIHLGDFKRFVLALALVAGKDVVFDEAFEVPLPLSIPGTKFVLVGDKCATIRGVCEGAIETVGPRRLLHVDAPFDPRAGVRVESCPVLTVGDAQIYLNPATFNLRGIGFPVEWTELPLEFQSRHAQAATEALGAIRRFQPATFIHFASALHTIGLKPRDDELFNVSASELPGAFVCSVPPSDPYVLAGSFIHEFYHNTLFCIEEAGQFFETTEDDQIEGETHYSPWVETLRPLHGILHAVYVFLPVFHFWSAVARDGTIDDGRLAYTRESIARIPVQLRMGINQLRRHAKFSAFGIAIFEEMVREVDAIEAEARALGANLKTPIIGMEASGNYRPFIPEGEMRPKTVGEMLFEHLSRCDLNGECAEDKAHLMRALG